MASERELLPLFLLNMVLFPNSRTQIHVFEQKYREMITFCLENNRPFGVALIRSGDEVGDTPEPYLVGTKVRIVDTYRYEDGRFDLTVEGVERFRIREFNYEAPFLRGKIENVYELEEPDQGRLFDDLDGVILAGRVVLEGCQHDFAVVALSQHLQERKVVGRHPPVLGTPQCTAHGPQCADVA